MTAARTLRTLRHLSPAQVFWRGRARMSAPWFGSSLYGRWLLAPRRDVALRRTPPALWPGDAENGRRNVAGRIRLLGRERDLFDPVDWDCADQSALWRFTLHYFEWLGDLRAAAAAGDALAAARARALVADWMVRHPRPWGLAWHAYPLSLRLYAWLVHAPFLLDGAGQGFREGFVQSLDRQARHLVRTLERDVGGNHLIKNLKALVACALCLEGWEPRLARFLAMFERALARQVLADGCHYERSPAYHLQVLGDAIDLAALLGESGRAAPFLDDAIRRMAGALAFFRHGDGALALFNDGGEGDREVLAALEARLGGWPRAPAALAAAGYFRLAAGGTLVLADAGRCGPDQLPAHAHADALSFEMSDGRQRMIVNCGTYAYQDADWRNRLRGTPAHSTVDIDGTDSAEVYGVFRVGRRPRRVAGCVAAHAGAIAFEGVHDGYRHLGVAHRRRLRLSADGRRLDGEDVIEARSTGPRRANAHFHLHPGVRVVVEGADAVRLVAPGAAWRFAAPGEAVALEASVYAPRFHEMHESRQVVLGKALGEGATTLCWSLTKLG